MSTTAIPALTIIIPVLNEAANLGPCLSSIPFSPSIEVIICDGGSMDDTLEIARESPATLITSPPGRALQMNAAARCARGDILLFLHADTQLPQGACPAIIEALAQGHTMGCFERRFKSTSTLLTLTSRCAGWRVRKSFLAYGDQGIFIQRHLFEQLGGYREIKRFEDLDLAIRAKQHGTWTVIPSPLLTDARRFGRHPLPRIIHDALLTLTWLAQHPSS